MSSSDAQQSSARDWSDTDSFVSLSRSLREDLWRTEGPFVVSNIDEQRTVASFHEPEEIALSYNMTTFAKGRGGAEGEHVWQGEVDGTVDAMLQAKRAAGEVVRILQLGTHGTSAWGIHMALKYPFAEIITLHNAVNPGQSPDLPANLTVEIGSFKSGDLSYPDDFFSLVSSSLNLVTVDDHIRLIEENHRVLQPGGMMGLGEWDAKFYAARPEDPGLRLVVDRDASYDAALSRKYPDQAAAYAARNIVASSLGHSVRSTGLFKRVEDRCDPLDYTATTGHPLHLLTGRHFLTIAWTHSRDALGLTPEENAMMKELDERIIRACPPGVISDYFSVLAIKA